MHRAPGQDGQERDPPVGAGELPVGEARLRAMADAATDSIFIKDRDRRYSFVNRTMCQLFGVGPGDLLGRVPEEVFDPASARTVREVDDRTFRGEVVRAIRELDVGGTRHVFQTTQVPLQDPDGDIGAICGFVQDVTALRQAEADLRQERTFADSLVDLAPALICVFDCQGRVVRYNRYVEKMTGIPLEQARGRDWFLVFLPPGESDRVRTFFLRTAVLQETSGTMNGVRSHDGGYRRVEWHSRPLVRQDGTTEGVLAVGLDLTDRLQAEEERQRMEREVQRAQRLESLAVLAGGIAHDFNNILLSVMGHASLAVLDVEPGSDAARSLQSIEVAAARASDLCHQLLAYSGRGTLTRTVFDLNPIVEETLELLRVSLTDPTGLAWNRGPGVLPVDGDATRIRQVVMNLVTNAAEALGATPGRIQVATSALDLPGLPVEGRFVTDPPRPGPWCLLEVTDTGQGMDEGTAARIFDPFFSTKFAGRGLGLPAVLGIVREHGGALSVRSAPGRGTTFRVLLPRSDRLPVPPDMADSRMPRTCCAGGTVLVVDDEPPNLEVIRCMLTGCGYTVRTAPDGDVGVDLFRQEPDGIRLVILDLTMPRQDGIESFRQIRGLRPDVPVIVMSGYEPEEAMRHMRDAPRSIFLRKPFSFDGLRAAIDTLLSDGTATPDAPPEESRN